MLLPAPHTCKTPRDSHSGTEEPMGLSAKAEGKADNVKETTRMTYSLPCHVSTRVRLSNTFILF